MVRDEHKQGIRLHVQGLAEQYPPQPLYECSMLLSTCEVYLRNMSLHTTGVSEERDSQSWRKSIEEDERLGPRSGGNIGWS